jgi:hypothetical protein
MASVVAQYVFLKFALETLDSISLLVPCLGQ